MFAQIQPKHNFRKHINEHMKHGTHNQHVVNLCASMRILCAYPHPHANTNCLTSMDSQTYKRFRVSFATRFGHLQCNLATELPRTQLSRKRRGEPTNEPTNPWPIPCTPMRIYAHTMRVPTHPHANKNHETTFQENVGSISKPPKQTNEFIVA